MAEAATAVVIAAVTAVLGATQAVGQAVAIPQEAASLHLRGAQGAEGTLAEGIVTGIMGTLNHCTEDLIREPIIVAMAEAPW